jgi:hypothetical protein
MAVKCLADGKMAPWPVFVCSNPALRLGPKLGPIQRCWLIYQQGWEHWALPRAPRGSRVGPASKGLGSPANRVASIQERATIVAKERAREGTGGSPPKEGGGLSPGGQAPAGAGEGAPGHGAGAPTGGEAVRGRTTGEGTGRPPAAEGQSRASRVDAIWSNKESAKSETEPHCLFGLLDA